MSAQPLRPYQAQAIATARQIYREHKASTGQQASILLVAPTGAGKTRIGVELVTAALSRPGADGVLWLAHRKELLQQAHARLLAEGLATSDVDILAPWAKRWPGARVHVASIGTLSAALGRGEELPRARVVVFDEAHHYVADEWGAVARVYQGSARLGLTATPERGDGRAMGDLFTHIVPVSSVRELIELGVLVPARVVAPHQPAAKLAEFPGVAYHQLAAGKRGFVFCATVEHAQQVADSLTALEHPASVIHADTPGPLRGALLASFASGEPSALRGIGSDLQAPRALCNVYALTEGVDVPAAEVCVLASKIKHSGGYLQRIGRVLRASPGKDRALIIDLHGNVLRHGLPDAEREYSLEGKAIEVSGKNGPHKPTSCGECGAVFAKWSCTPDGRRVCPECRWVGPLMPDPAAVERKELLEVGPMASVRAREKRLEMLIEDAQARERKPGWVWHKFRDLFGVQMGHADWRRVKAAIPGPSGGWNDREPLTAEETGR